MLRGHDRARPWGEAISILQSPRLRSRGLLLLTAMAACLVVASTWRVFGNAWDEPEHLAAGMVLLDRDLYLYDNQHPPLARLAAAIGPRLAGADLPDKPSPFGEEAGRQILYHSHASYDTLLDLARAGMLPFLFVLVFAQWYWLRANAGEAEAWLALGFVLSTPAILGHAGFVAVDVPVTAMCVLAFQAMQRWLEHPTLRRCLWLGVACGLAISTKISALPFLALTGLAWLATLLLLRRQESRPQAPPPWGRWLGGGTLALLVAVVVAVAVYGPRLVYLTTPDLQPSRALDLVAGSTGWLHDAVYHWAARVPVPLGVQELPLAILGVEWHNEHGHLAYLLGETSWHGWWYFYPVALAVKTPLPLLLAGLAGFVLLARRGWRERQLGLLAAPVAFVVILLFCCFYSHINIGVRHVLVLYPLLAIGAAAFVAWCWRKARALPRMAAGLARAAVLGLLAWQAAILALAYPDYLAYFNATAGEHPETILVDSDLDWGQDLRRLSQELARRNVQSLYLAYRGTADLTREGLPPFQPLVPTKPVSGWIAIDMLSLKEGRGDLGWLTAHAPVMRVGKSIDLYYLPDGAAPAGP